MADNTVTEQLLLFETYSQLVSDATQVFRQTKDISAHDLRAVIKERIVSARETCSQYPVEQLQQAEFAVCAWLDEYLLARNWPGCEMWRTNLLQDEYFHTTDAGILFYTRCEKLTSEDADLLHLYFFCLATGFRGQYFSVSLNPSIEDAMNTLLTKIGQEQAAQLLNTQGLLVGNLSLPVKRPASRKRRYWLWVILPWLLIACIYAYFYFSIVNNVRSFLTAIS